MEEFFSRRSFALTCCTVAGDEAKLLAEIGRKYREMQRFLQRINSIATMNQPDAPCSIIEIST